MKKKYFTPKIEEIYIGYETEEISNFFGEFSTFRNFPNLDSLEAHYLSEEISSTPVIIDSNKLVELMLLNNLPRREGGKRMLGTYRTPYLTKEQIENEGWVLKGKSTCLWFDKEGDFERTTYTLYKATLYYNLEDKWLSIYLHDCGDKIDIFQGKCLCINDFRKIMKYLSINT